MARAVTDGVPVSDVAVTVPAHWRVSVVDILRRNLRGRLPVVSDATAATAIVADLPGHRADIRVTRTELEDLMAAPLSEFLAVLDETRERYGVPAGSVSAVATVGGGARIPLITQRLSEHLRAPVVTTPHPQLTAAEGAALIAYRSRVVDTATALTPTAPAAAPTTATIATADPSSALAWSEDAASEDVLPYSDVTDSRPEVHFRHEEWQDAQQPRRGLLVLFGLSAVAAAIAAAVFGITLLSDTTTTPVEAATTSTTSPAPAAPASFPATPAPQAPPSDHRRRAAAPTAVLSRAAGTEYAGAGDPQRAADDDASYDVRAAAGDGSDTAADATDLTADIS